MDEVRVGKHGRLPLAAPVHQDQPPALIPTDSRREIDERTVSRDRELPATRAVVGDAGGDFER